MLIRFISCINVYSEALCHCGTWISCITTAEGYAHGLVGDDVQKLPLVCIPSSRRLSSLARVGRTTTTTVSDCRWSDIEKLKVGSEGRQVVIALFNFSLLFLKHSLKSIDLFCFFADCDMKRVVTGLF